MLKLVTFSASLTVASTVLYAQPIQITAIQDNAPSSLSTPSITLQRKGAGKNNVVQGIALDQKRDLAYTMHVTGNPEKGAINRFNFNTSTSFIQSKDVQLPSSMIGHQGITVDPATGDLLTSAGKDIKNRGWHIVRFRYTPNAVPTFQIIPVFTKGYSKGANAMPSFSPDGRYLVIRGNKDKTNIIRVYERPNLESLATQKPRYEWAVTSGLTSENYPFQALTTDGRYVYMLSGNGNPNLLKRLHIYTIQGQLVQKIDNLSLGQAEAKQMGSASVWEPEGLTFNLADNQLYIFYGVGEKGKKLGRIYKVQVN